MRRCILALVLISAVALIGRSSARSSRSSISRVSAQGLAEITSPLPASDMFQLVGTVGPLLGQPTAVAADGAAVYVGFGAQIGVFDMTLPNNPVLRSTTALTSTVQALAAYGNVLYVATAGAGLQVFDVTDAARPRALAVVVTRGSVWDVVIAGRAVYFRDEGGLRIVERVGGGDGPESSSGGRGSIAVSSTTVLLTVAGGLDIIDAADPRTPRVISHWNGEARAVAAEGKIASVIGSDLHILDIGASAAPREIGSLNINANRVVMSGTRLYIPHEYRHWFLVVDVTTPTAPQLIGEFREFWGSGLYDIAIAGSFMYVITNDRDEPMQVFNIADGTAPYRVTTFTPAPWYAPRDAFAVVTGARYAYVAEHATWYDPEPRWSRLVVVDRTEPFALREVDVLDSPGTWISSLVLREPFLYVADGSTLRVFDVSTPAKLRELSRTTVALRADHLAVAGNRAYLGSYEGITVLDIANPQAPQQLGTLAWAWYPQQLAVSGETVYAAAQEDGLRIVDVSTPASPREIGVLLQLTDTRAVAVTGTHALVTTKTSLQILDITVPTSPRVVGSVAVTGSAITVAGSTAYLSAGLQGLHVVDISDPTAPRLIGTYATSGNAQMVAADVRDLFVADGAAGLTALRYLPPTSAVIDPVGGELVSEPDQTTYQFGAGVFATPVTVTHRPLVETHVQTAGALVQTGHSFDVVAHAQDGQLIAPAGAFSLRVRVRPDEFGTAQRASPALYAWDGAAWVREPTSVLDRATSTISARPTRLGQWAVLGEPLRLFLPLVRSTNSNLTVTGVELTQATQDPDNTVPLIEDRPAVVRVYAQTSSKEPVVGVSMSLEGMRDGRSLPGSPLFAPAQAVFPAPWSGVSPRRQHASSFLFHLPAEWLSGTVAFVATVNPNQEVAESNTGDNTLMLTRTFNAVPPLRVTIVPIDYTHAPTGQRYTVAASDVVSDYLLRTYPVSRIQVSFHPPLAFEGDLTKRDEWYRLFSNVGSLKMANGADFRQIYFGLLPDPQDAAVLSMFSGLGGGRVAVAIYGGVLAAHEIGHALGLGHAPGCRAPDPDPSFPYFGGSIGQYGVDVARNRIWTPFYPDYGTDFMGYCGESPWISDYHYTHLYNTLRQLGAAPAPVALTDVLFVRALQDAQGHWSLQPAYTGIGVPELRGAAGDYQIALINAAGAVVAAYPVAPTVATEDDITAHFVATAVPHPEEDIAAIRLMVGNSVLAERPITRRAPVARSSMGLTHEPESTLIHWGTPAIPALVRYTADRGQSWLTLGVDVLGGELRVASDTLPLGHGTVVVSLADSGTTIDFPYATANLVGGR